MAFCRSCGNEIQPNINVCPQCGVPQQKSSTAVDDGGFLWGLLGFCVPIAGLVIFLIWKDERPYTAKAAGIGALVSVGLGVLFYIIMFVFIGALGAM